MTVFPRNTRYTIVRLISGGQEPFTYLTEYKKSGINRHIYRHYSLDEISELMVSKQADLIQLFALMPTLVPKEIVMKNFEFYNEKCLHDSSLSLSAFAIVAAQIKHADLAHTFFRGALDTDFGETAANSAAGIHAANCGGIWQCVTFGFAGVSVEDGVLALSPALPAAWNALELNLYRNGGILRLRITHHEVCAVYNGKDPLPMNICGKKIIVRSNAAIPY